MITLSNFTKFAGITAAIATTLVVGSKTQAATVALSFEGIGDGAQILDFYNGGTDSRGNRGTNYGISFTSDVLGLIDSDVPGGSGIFANEPSPSTILFFGNGGTAIMNVAAGFDEGFSFYYSAAQSGSVDVYDGLNGTGNLLSRLNLNVSPVGNGDPTGVYNVFVPIGVSFSGIAKSVDFGRTPRRFIAFDNVTLGSFIPEPPSTPVPEPFTIVGTLIGATAAYRTRKRLKATNKPLN